MNHVLFADLFGNPFAPLMNMCLIGGGIGIVLAVVVAVIRKAHMDSRLRLMREEPEIYKEYVRVEEREQARLKESMEKSKETAGKVASGAASAAVWAAKTFLKK